MRTDAVAVRTAPRRTTRAPSRLCRDARRVRTASLRTRTDARPVRTGALPLRTGTTPCTDRSPTQTDGCPDPRTGCLTRNSGSTTRSSGSTAHTSGSTTRSSGCSTQTERRRTKTTTEFAKSHAVIAIFSPCLPHFDAGGPDAASAARDTTRPFPRAFGNVVGARGDAGRARGGGEAFLRPIPSVALKFTRGVTGGPSGAAYAPPSRFSARVPA